MELGLGLSRTTFQLYGSEREKLKRVCQEMESTFLYTLLKEMSKGLGKDLFSTDFSQGIYRDLRNLELSRVLAQRSPLGLADLVYKAMGKFL